MQSLGLPKITIITPSYNQAQYIEQTICSILEQGYTNLEYIIIDGGSSDGSVEIIKKYESQITYWVSEKDRGQSHAINKGLAHATGEIFNWINSDDYLEPGALFHIAECFQNNPEVKAVGGYCRLFNNQTPFSIISRIGRDGTTEENIIHYWMNQPSTFFKTEIIKEFGGVNETLHYCMDLELWFRFLAKYSIQNIYLSRHLLSHFRHHDDSKTEKVNELFIAEHKIILAHLCNVLKIDSNITNHFQNLNSNFSSTNSWCVDAINKKNFENILSYKYHHDFYDSKNYKALRKALWFMIRSNQLHCSRYFLSLVYKSISNR
jgi:glycosyltransferase involved in cell wall biosynthesis